MKISFATLASSVMTITLALFISTMLNNVAAQSLQYPVFQNTGNPQQDSANYVAALQQYDNQKATSLSSARIDKPAGKKDRQRDTEVQMDLGAALSPLSASRTAAESCIIPTDATWSVLPGNDDGSTGLINLGFTFNLYGTNYNSCYINNNGNITFTNSYFGYTPTGFPMAGTPMVSAFWDDIDTRTCGAVRYKLFGTRLVVSYEVVGQYSQNCGLRNTFQIVIGTLNDPLIGNGQNVKFFYGDMQWSKGASTVGINSGSAGNYVQVGRFGVQGSTAYDGGGGNTDGVDYLDYQCFSFNVSNVGNQPPSLSGFPTGNTVSLGCGETATYTIQSLPPEVNQTVTTTVNTNGMCGVSTSITNGAVSTVNITVIGNPCNAGTNVITFTSTDNGNPALTTTSTLTVIVGIATPTITASGPTAFCEGGSVTLTSSPAASYSWSNGATSQSITVTQSGNYTVTTFGAQGCSVVSDPLSVTVHPNPAATINASGPTTFCQGGSVTLTASAGASYLWSTGANTQSINASSAGSYTVTVTQANGCSSVSSPTVVAITGGPDSDGDGMPDACDADDDNDGITDFIECNSSNFYWSNAPVESGNTATGTINGINYVYTSSQTVLTSPSVFSHSTFPASYNIPNIKCIKNIYTTDNSLTFSSPIANPVLVFASIGQGGIHVPIEFGVPIDILWSTNVVKNSATRMTGNEGYAIVRLNGIFSNINFNYLATENYVNFLFGADFQSCGDTDSDGILDYLDTDSDGDGCSDAIEGSQNPLASSIVNDRLTGGIDANGVPLVVNGGQGIGTSKTANVNCHCQPGIDRTPPVPNVATLPTITGQCRVDLTIPSATDACAGSVAGTTSSPMMFVNQGTYSVTWTYTDGNGNSSQQTQTVIVDDTTPPVITLNGNGALTGLGAVATYHPTVTPSPNGGLSHAHGIAYDLQRNTVWVTDQDLGNNVVEFAATQPSGSTLPVLTRFNPGMPSTIEGIAFDPTDNTLWIVDFNANVKHVSRTGTVLTGGFSAAGTIPVGTFGARGLGITIENNYIWIDNGVRAYKFHKSGGAYAGFNFVTGQPGITYDPERNLLWSSGWNDNKYRAYNPATGALVFTSGAMGLIQGHDLSIGAGKIWVASENGNPDKIYSIEIIGGQFDQIVECHSTYTDPGYTASDNCVPAPPVVVTNNVNTDVPGIYTITYSATDPGGNTTVATRTVTVLDRLIPVPAVAVLPVITGECSATVTAPQANDACAGTITGTTNSPLTFSTQGTFTIVWKYDDGNGNVTTQNQTVIVDDVTAPVPDVAALPTITGECAASATAPTATDNCKGQVIGTTNSPLSYTAQGTYTIVWKYDDGNGNVTTQNQTVIVDDVTPPVISCPFNITVNADAGQCGAVVNYSAPSATDNCGSGTLPTSLAGHTYMGTFGGHTYFLSNSVTDPETAHANAIAAGGHLVTIGSEAENAFVSAMNPNFIWIGFTDRTSEGTFGWVTSEPVSFTKWNSGEPNNYLGDEDWAVINWGPNGTWNDWFYYSTALYVIEFEGGNIPTTQVSGLGSGAMFPVGTTTETWQATDAGGNTVTCSFTVTVIDNQVPTVACPAPVVVSTDPGKCSAFVTVPAPAISDNCNVVCNTENLDEYTTGVVSGKSPQWTLWPGGTSAMVTNERYLSAPNSLKVTGSPNGGPVDQVFNLGNQTGGNWTLTFSMYIPSGNTGYYNLQHTESLNSWAHQVKFHSNGTGVLNATSTNTTFSYPQGQWFEVKQLINQLTDQTSLYINNVLVRTWQFSTHANTPALNNMLGAFNFYPISNTGYVGSPEPNPSAPALFYVDNITLCGDAARIGAYVSRRYSKIYPKGTTPVAITITDKVGNKTVCGNFTVTVNDTESPVLAGVPANQTVQCNAVPQAAVVTATDNCPGVGQVSYSEVKTNGNCSGNYTLTRTWSVTDASGNTTTGTQVITVEDTEAPAFTRPADVVLYKDAACSVDASPEGAAGDVTDEDDNCSTGLNATYSDVVVNGCEGTYTVTRTWSLVDNCGNAAATQVQTITVKDVIAPTFTRPADVVLYKDAECSVDASPAGAAGDVTDEDDNCSTGLNATYSDVVVNGCEGTYTITRTWSLVDNCGNAAATQVQTITVKDNTAPTFTRPADITIYTDASCGYDASLAQTGDVTNEQDNCSTGIQATYSDVVTAGACQGTHIIKRTWSLVDNCGNAAASQVQTITVSDNTAPVVTYNVASVFHCFDTTGNNYSVAALTATDNCTSSVSYAYTVYASNGSQIRTGTTNNASGSFHVGTNTVSWTITDDCGNVSTATTLVTINPPITGTINGFTVVPNGAETNTLYLGYTPASTAIITITAGGGTAPYTYSWSTTAPAGSFAAVAGDPSSIKVIAVAAGIYTYTATVTDAKGCVATFTKIVRVVDVRCGNKMDKVLVCHKTGSASNPWVQICIAPAAVATHLGNGSYLGVCTTAPAVTQTTKPAVTEMTTPQVVIVYPNPNQGQFNIQLKDFAEGKVQVKIMDALGRTVQIRELNVSNPIEMVSFDLKQPAGGVYHAQVISERGVTSTRIVIAR